jgi:hypothetical protein
VHARVDIMHGNQGEVILLGAKPPAPVFVIPGPVMPTLDPRRVAALRHAIMAGTYRIDAAAIARALLRFENGLYARPPLAES